MKLTPQEKARLVRSYKPGQCSMLDLSRDYRVSVSWVSKLIRMAGGNCAKRVTSQEETR